MMDSSPRDHPYVRSARSCPIETERHHMTQQSAPPAARRLAARVTVFLMNGYQLRGVITAFDPYVVVVVSDGKQQVIYKHAISTIAPEHPVELEA